MTPRLSFRPGARAEIQAARRWYQREAGLGRAFLGEVDATLGFVLQYPEMYEAIDTSGAVRRALLHRFPFALFYEVSDDGNIVVLACLHVRDDPQRWPTRP